jgi:2-keto-4-pentenoate hydratase/2-oxohepta-3-ene-1,7-dioic acid hydratase in catechol pathway
MGEIIERLNVPTIIDLILSDGEADSSEDFKIGDVRLVAPIQKPSKIVSVGLNYREHIKELGHQYPMEPVIFSKPSSAIIGPGDRIIIPEASDQVDYEGEVAVIIGKEAHKVEGGARFIFGYTCINDITARDIQRRSQDWTRVKGFDTFAPMGPTINTAKPACVKTYLNGNQAQKTSTDDMIFGFEELVENISQVMTLLPGDVIATGTPVGVGKLSPGDKAVVEADGIGRLENPVASDESTD